jgi:hypothetical protein
MNEKVTPAGAVPSTIPAPVPLTTAQKLLQAAREEKSQTYVSFRRKTGKFDPKTDLPVWEDVRVTSAEYAELDAAGWV